MRDEIKKVVRRKRKVVDNNEEEIAKRMKVAEAVKVPTAGKKVQCSQCEKAYHPNYLYKHVKKEHAVENMICNYNNILKNSKPNIKLAIDLKPGDRINLTKSDGMKTKLRIIY